MRSGLEFRKLLRSERPKLGIFVKIPHPQIIEILLEAQLDFIILDMEHAAFGTAALDQCLMVARLAGLPALVRVPQLDRVAIGCVLDQGAAGIVVPHVSTRAAADEACRLALFKGGSRSISASHRAGDYGRRDLAGFASDSDEAIAIVVQIEDQSALAEIDQIVAADRVDCFFVGRADLALSMGETDFSAPRVTLAVESVARAVIAAGKTLGGFVDASEITAHLDQGFSFLAAGTDQGMLRAGVDAMRSQLTD